MYFDPIQFVSAAKNVGYVFLVTTVATVAAVAARTAWKAGSFCAKAMSEWDENQVKMDAVHKMTERWDTNHLPHIELYTGDTARAMPQVIRALDQQTELLQKMLLNDSVVVRLTAAVENKPDEQKDKQ